MNLGEIYIYINAMIAKEVEGNTFNPVTFNSVIKNTDIELFKDEWEMLDRQAKAQGKPLYELLFSGSPLRKFTESYSGPAHLGILLLSAVPLFEQFIACTVHHDGIYKDVELVDIPEAMYRKSKLDGSILNESPIVSLYKDGLHFLPTNLSAIGAYDLELIYLRMPVSPFFDYYIKNSTGKAYYLPPGYYATGSWSSSTIKNSVGVTIDTMCTVPYNTANATPYNSASVELEWKTSYHGEFIKRILIKAGVPIRDSFIIQAAGGGNAQ